VFIDVEEEMYKEAESKEGGWRGFKDFIVVDKVKESDVITSFYLEPKDGGVVPMYDAGQYLSVRVLTEGAEHKIFRHYKLLTKPNGKQFRKIVRAHVRT